MTGHDSFLRQTSAIANHRGSVSDQAGQLLVAKCDGCDRPG
jgi:hypothetical protein